MFAPKRFSLPLFAVLLIAAAALLLAVHPARSQVQIDITQGVQEPLPIAVTDFYGVGAEEAQAGVDIAGVISANLSRSGLFRPIDKAAFIQSSAALQNGPTFSEWRVINAQALVSGTVQVQQDGRYRVEFRLFDVINENQMVGLAYFTTPDNWRRVAHKISDLIYQTITGEQGYFDTRIVYIAESGPANARVKRLAIMDQDGANHQYLTDGETLVLTPRFSPSAQEITYLAYYNDRPRVYLLNIDSGRQELLGDFPGMTFAPRFSPDGNRVIMSMAEGGNTEIYTMDLRTRQTQRLTNNPAIDTSPSFSPDGTRVVFESDRGGSQQLYVMSANGGDAQRISFGEGRYASPVWSPRGDLIAFTKLHQGRFFIGVMRPDGSGERILVDAFHVEGPTWAPNGRVLMYFSEQPSGAGGEGRSVKLYTVDLTGSNRWTVPIPQDGSDPAWSPLLP
ncbi:Tol-Pal system beta propeller repeat protein TolB [Inquilinus sp. CAU 1745]|uniref:Tol-Pal system beta propeller repeat protein TolB n=1 Tax=Inquilinus sp. CAU 1745 TaxID=3140369 RepID=UPI00325A97D0